MCVKRMEQIEVSGDFRLVGQLVYDKPESEVIDAAGIRVYRDVDPEHRMREFMCIEDPRTQHEAWYRIDGTRVIPVSLSGLEFLQRDPR